MFYVIFKGKMYYNMFYTVFSVFAFVSRGEDKKCIRIWQLDTGLSLYKRDVRIGERVSSADDRSTPAII